MLGFRIVTKCIISVYVLNIIVGNLSPAFRKFIRLEKPCMNVFPVFFRVLDPRGIINTSATPDNPVIAGTSEEQEWEDGTMVQHVEMTRDEMLFQPSEVCSETMPESGTALMMQASSPMWVNYLELGGNTPPSWMSPRRGSSDHPRGWFSGIHAVNTFTNVMKAKKTKRER